MADIQLNNVIKRFGEVQTIHGVDLDIKHGEFVVFVGPSGCGKSTLLRLVAGLEEITEGEVRIGDRIVNDVDPAERGVAMVFQSYALYPHMTVAENMGFGMKMNKVAPSLIDEKVRLAAETLQLTDLLDRKPKQLSGGQRQRVAIGRAIVRDPDVFLFDEPLSNLDAELRVEMRLQISRLHEKLATSMIYVTHDQVEAMTLADKIVVLRDGRVEQVGAPLELYYKPANEFVAGFIGSPKMNFMSCVVESLSGDEVMLVLPDSEQISLPKPAEALTVGQQLKLGLRPEHVGIGTQSGPLTLAFACDVIERLGNNTYLFGATAGVDGFKIQIPGNVAANSHETFSISFSAEHCLLFDQQGRCISH